MRSVTLTDDPIKVSTRGNELNNYKLVESGADTGIFIGEVTLAGFAFDADGDSSTGTDGNDITGTPSNFNFNSIHLLHRLDQLKVNLQPLTTMDLLSPLNSQRMKQL